MLIIVFFTFYFLNVCEFDKLYIKFKQIFPNFHISELKYFKLYSFSNI